MILTDIFNKMKAYFIPLKSYDEANKHIIRKWLGHTKRYDLTENLLSDEYENKKERVVVTYYPGTSERKAHRRMLKESHYSKKDKQFWEKWYLLGHKRYALVKGQIDDPDIGRIPAYIYSEGDTLFDYEVLNNVQHSIFQKMQHGSTFSLNLNKMAYSLSDTLDDISTSYVLRKPYMTQFKDIVSSESKIDQIKEVQKEKVETLQEGKTSESKKENDNTFAKESTNNTGRASEEDMKALKEFLLDKTHKEFEVPSPEQIKRDQWEGQLLQRMEKHDWLIAQKAKVEASVRMKPERKAERLISLEKRIKQNEKAQAILNRKLAILSAVQNRADWKQIQQEERKDYKDMSLQQKAQRQKIKSLPNSVSKEELSGERLELKQIKQLKQESYDGYRYATRVTKMAGESLKKLRDTKRQNTIFELSYVVREKIALEKAFKTETDETKRGVISERLKALRQEKRSLIENFRAIQRQKKSKVSSKNSSLNVSLQAQQKSSLCA